MKMDVKSKPTMPRYSPEQKEQAVVAARVRRPRRHGCEGQSDAARTGRRQTNRSICALDWSLNCEL